MHAIGGFEVVFQQHRDAVQRAAHRSALAFGIETLRNPQRLGVQFDKRVDRRTRFVQRGDAIEVLLHDRTGADLALGHALLQIGNTRALECERCRLRHGRIRGHALRCKETHEREDLKRAWQNRHSGFNPLAINQFDAPVWLEDRYA